MKRLRYDWTDAYYLLHLQFSMPATDGLRAVITRTFDGRPDATEVVTVAGGVPSHRTMLCRSHPTERSFAVEYADAAVLRVYELDDRAHFPPQPRYVQ